jgi:DNA-binding transcriptional regulator YdaS (Cro superfamily)
MDTFEDFVAWAGTQKQAGDLIGVNASMVSLILSGKRTLQPEHAIKAERASGGLYRADDMLPTIEFVRNARGEVDSYCVRTDVGHD